MDWSIAKGYRADNPVAAVNAVLPKNGNGKSHHRAMPWQQVPKAIKTVRNTDAYLATKLAFEFLVLTATRSGEVRLAKWSEIDIHNEIWTIPADRMKAGVEHIVPLSKQAIKVLLDADAAYPAGKDDWVFPSKAGKAISDGTISKLLRDHGVKAVPHGFQSSFRNWAAENKVTGEIAEAALAHTVKNQVEAAYRRTDFLDQRREVMKQWGRHCAGKK